MSASQNIQDVYYVRTSGAMLRSKTLSVLQKTYDDSYLSCSTAVYYESQGDETEATRHWRSALEHIYELNATKVSPTYTPQSDTEKALQDALKQLELQCKERIDLLEALRMSRQPDPSLPATSKLSKSPSTPAEMTPRSKGAIGEGTIPAVNYSDLSRPSIPNRPALPPRISSGNAVLAGPASRSTTSLAPMPSDNDGLSIPSPGLSVKKNGDKETRSVSPEKRTMRTTLRSGRPSDKSSGTSRKSPRPAAEGPSKAATLAWSAVSSREKHHRERPESSKASLNSPLARSSLDLPARSGITQSQWDSHSRKLRTPVDMDSSNAFNPVMGRHSDEYYGRPSLDSVSAASSALGSASIQDIQSKTQAQSRLDRNQAARYTSGSPRPSRSSPVETTSTGSASSYQSSGGHIANGSSSNINRKHGAVKKKSKSSSSSSKPNRQENRDHYRRQSHRAASRSSSSDVPINSGGRNVVTRRDRDPDVKSDTSEQSVDDTVEETSEDKIWKKKKHDVLKNLPPGVDELAAKQILNDIIVQGDEVRWDDIAGLEIAKNALRETVVYPFLRPDLFMGLREPARGMLLFGPPGTGKTMLARAVATESRSTFFSISASSLTSKYLGESEKLVKALFGLARALAPSIIFVDEIDSLLSQRSGSGEHEATRRIKTEFLIQWSDLQRAAAGRETTDKDKERGDANRVLVLAATNLPWAIDEAARRRFVRRQYIPLPEPTTRETQLRTLLGQQKHNLSEADIQRLVDLTDGFSGSDITSLAKDAAMGPLRSLGEALLRMSMDEIRPIMLVDFEASLRTIRPSVSKTGLKEYEDWAREFGERGG